VIGMRVNLITHALTSYRTGTGSFPISLTIRPACGLPGEYNFPTNSAELLRLLHQQTDLPSTVIERFKGHLTVLPEAKLLGVELSEKVLTKIGYFVD
jgi:hypothetical protein